MNFLAHLFLSGPPGDLMAGNFMADSVKGNAVQKYPAGIQKGILMHRAIDSYTDSHATVLKSKERLRKKFGKYAPVVIDVYYDHFLARHWSDYASGDLRSFSDEAYAFLKNYYELFPERTKRFYEYMTQYDILYSYSKIEGIDRVMKGMSRRARFESGMELAAEELQCNYEDYQDEFCEFFPQIQQHILTFAT
jgi:acyl carrier protein phosphodiesterase